MKRNRIFVALLSGALAAFTVGSVYAQTWRDYETSKDESALIAAIEKAGDSPEDIHTKNMAVKRLSIYGTAKAIPTLVASLSNEKLNFNARFALEAMPFDEVDAALAQATKDLQGYCLVGAIDTIGVRGKASAVATLKEIKLDDPAVRKAVYAAMGAIASDEAVDFLVYEASRIAPGAMGGAIEYPVLKGLGDAILDAGQKYEAAGDLAKAATIYNVAATGAFQKYIKESGLYRSLLCNGASSADKVVALLSGDDYSAADVALKTIREYKAGDAEAIVKAAIANLDSYDAYRQTLVARSFENLKDDAARKVAFPKLVELAKADSVAMRIAAIKALSKYADMLENASLTQNEGVESTEDLNAAKVALGVAIYKAKPGVFAGLKASTLLDDMDEADALIQLKIVENARIRTAGAALVEIANKKTGALRDAALSALSEIVELDSLELLVNALNGETDDQKVDWLLRAACTRMPREECAAAVAELFNKSNLEQRLKILPLLKQIGGKTALDAVAAACQGDTVDKATQILGEWNTPEDAQQVAEISLAIAKQAKDNKYHSRGIRGYIRVARQFELPVATKIEMCKVAFETARRADDKVLIFEVFKRNVTAENVAAALEYVKYPEFKDAACEAAVFVAEKIRVSQPAWKWTEQSGDAAKDAAAQILVDGMKKVVETTGSDDLKARAQKLL